MKNLTKIYHILDIDECKNPGACGVNALCSNYGGNYTCSCQEGYTGNPYDGVSSFIMRFPVWLRNRLISAGLKLVFSFIESSCLASYYSHFSKNIKNTKHKINTKTGFNLFYFYICRKLSITRCDE